MYRRLLVTLGAVSLLPAQAPRSALDTSKVIDLTYSFDESTIFWPTARAFHYERESWGISPGGYWYAAGRYSTSEHGGTHLDSPIHFGEGRATTDQITLSHLIGPAVVVDINSACAKNSDYRLTAGDLAAWEKAYRRIPGGTIVLVHTGWGKFWPDKKRYLGSDKPGDTDNLHFPGIAKDAAELLVKRKVHGVGIDTASLDHGPSKDFITHRVLNGAGVYGLENVANLEKVPVTGATLVALPMKIKGGTGGPVRIVAIPPE